MCRLVCLHVTDAGKGRGNIIFILQFFGRSWRKLCQKIVSILKEPGLSYFYVEWVNLGKQYFLMKCNGHVLLGWILYIHKYFEIIMWESNQAAKCWLKWCRDCIVKKKKKAIYVEDDSVIFLRHFSFRPKLSQFCSFGPFPVVLSSCISLDMFYFLLGCVVMWVM